jgi:two-component system NtrC family sensor kinase
VMVTDSGTGIDPAFAEKIFTPFFTTKKESEGTGIGLSLSRSIARRHEGELTLDLGQHNTSFKLSLPRNGRRVIEGELAGQPSRALQ